MNIILEGPDVSGKSTLARYLAKSLGRSIVPGEGWVKRPGELVERIDRMHGYTDAIFDRHPCVSQEIYRQLDDGERVDVDQLVRFYDTAPLFIFCKGPHDLTEHKEKDYDTPDKLELLKNNHKLVCEMYEQWALHYAHIIYRRGEGMERVLKLIKAFV